MLIMAGTFTFLGIHFVLSTKTEWPFAPLGLMSFVIQFQGLHPLDIVL